MRPDSGRHSGQRIPAKITADFLEECDMRTYIKVRSKQDEEYAVNHVAEAVSVKDEKGR